MNDFESNALLIQAYADGQLSGRRKREVEALLEAAPEAALTLQAVRQIKDLLADSELPRETPESREFYWSKIAHAIERAEAPVRVSPGPSLAWRVLKWTAPLGGLAALALILTLFQNPAPPSPSNEANSGTPALALEHEIETALSEANYFTFRSEKAAMTVVWLDTHYE